MLNKIEKRDCAEIATIFYNKASIIKTLNCYVEFYIWLHPVKNEFDLPEVLESILG